MGKKTINKPKGWNRTEKGFVLHLFFKVFDLNECARVGDVFEIFYCSNIYEKLLL